MSEPLLRDSRFSKRCLLIHKEYPRVFLVECKSQDSAGGICIGIMWASSQEERFSGQQRPAESWDLQMYTHTS